MHPGRDSDSSVTLRKIMTYRTYTLLNITKDIQVRVSISISKLHITMLESRACKQTIKNDFCKGFTNDFQQK